MMKSSDPELPPFDPDLARSLRSMTRRGLAWGGLAALSGVIGAKWLTSRTLDGGIAWPLRRILEFDEKVHHAAFGPTRLATLFPASSSKMPRVNGRIGINPQLDLDAWKLQVSGPTGSTRYSMAEVKALPRFEITTELKCIEGWSEIVTWAGARLADLATLSGKATRSGRPIDLEGSPGDLLPYASVKTPNLAYYVGLEAASVLHPQTLLCYEMNGRPLEPLHGAPLRLAVPVKYGIKSLKQVGSIEFVENRPADYWAKKGYDWYSGH